MRDQILTLEEALREGMESEGRELHRILTEALAKRGLPEPTYTTYPDGVPRHTARHPGDWTHRLVLEIYRTDPVYSMDGHDPQAILSIRRDPNMEDWVSLTMQGSGEGGKNRQLVKGPFHNDERPLYEAYLGGVEKVNAPFPRWKDQPRGYTHFNDREKALTIATWMVEHFFTLK